MQVVCHRDPVAVEKGGRCGVSGGRFAPKWGSKAYIGCIIDSFYYIIDSLIS